MELHSYYIEITKRVFFALFVGFIGVGLVQYSLRDIGNGQLCCCNWNKQHVLQLPDCGKIKSE